MTKEVIHNSERDINPNSENDREACRINSKLKTDDEYSSEFLSVRDTFYMQPQDKDTICHTSSNQGHHTYI